MKEYFLVIETTGDNDKLIARVDETRLLIEIDEHLSITGTQVKEFEEWGLELSAITDRFIMFCTAKESEQDPVDVICNVVVDQTENAFMKITTFKDI